MHRTQLRTRHVAGLFSAAVLLLGTNVQAQDGELPPLPAPPEAPWYELVQLSGFVDGYASLNYNFPKPAAGANATTHAHDSDTGFALAWAGLDASYPAEPVGGTVSLRWGPAADTYSANEPRSLVPVKQAFASWRPGGAESGLTLDFGKFNTVYGAEVGDSQANVNYTRGVVYWLAQPTFHTGLRASWQAADSLTLRALAVNGWNNSVDTNVGKSFGLQLGWAMSDRFEVSLGWLGGPEQADSFNVECAAGTAYDPSAEGCASAPNTPAESYRVDRGGANDLDAWRHLLDAVVSWNPSDALGFVVNVDYGWEGIRQTTLNSETDKLTWFGAMAAGRYAFDATWAIALRGEYFKVSGEEGDDGLPKLGAGYFPFGVADLSMATATLTLEVKPTDNLIIRLENRGDFALDAHASAGDGATEVFPKKVRDSADRQLTTTLGVVVTTN